MKRKTKPYEGTIVQRGNRHTTYYWIRGRQYTRSFFTEEEAITFLTNETLRKRQGHSAGSPNLKMGKILDLVISDQRTSRNRNVAAEVRRIENHLRPRFGNRRVRDFRVSDIKDYIQERRKENVTDSTINRELALIRRAFNLAFESEWIDYRVPVKMLRERPQRKEPFKEGEFDSFIKHLPDDVQRATLFQREAGWRMPSEVLPLEWNQIDFDNECVSLPPYSTKEDSPEPRRIFFTSVMRELLKSQREYVDAIQKQQRRIIRWVFPDASGDPLFFEFVDKEGVKQKKANAYFLKCWELALKRSKISRKGTHNLRVTAAVERDSAGLSLEDNRRAGGWETNVMVDRYLNKTDEDAKAAARKIDEYRKQRDHNKSTTSKNDK